MIPEAKSSKPEITVSLKEAASSSASSGIVANRRQELKKRLQSRRQELKKRLSEGSLVPTSSKKETATAPSTAISRGVPRSNSCSKIFLRGVRVVDVVGGGDEHKPPKLKRGSSEPSQIRKMASIASSSSVVKRDQNHSKRGSTRLVAARMQCRRQELSRRMSRSSGLASEVPKEIDATPLDEDSSARSDISADDDDESVVVDISTVDSASEPTTQTQESAYPQDDERVQKAAVVIQNFFREIMILMDGIKYWEAEKKDVERRRQEELMDLQRQVEVEKQQLQVQHYLDTTSKAEEVDDDDIYHNLEWGTWSQWVTQETKKAMALKDEADWLRGSILQLSSVNKRLEREIRQKEQSSECLQEKVRVWEEEQVQLKSVLNGLKQDKDKIQLEVAMMTEKRSPTALMERALTEVANEARAQVEAWESILQRCEQAKSDMNKVKTNQHDKAARCIQRFFNRAKAIMTHHRKEALYLQGEKKAVERRHQQELLDIQQEIEMKKQLLQVEFRSNPNEEDVDVPSLDLARDQIKEIQKEKENQQELRRAIWFLSHRNEQLAAERYLHKGKAVLCEFEQTKRTMQGKLVNVQKSIDRERRWKQLCEEYIARIVTTVNWRSEDPVLFNAIGKIPKSHPLQSDAVAGKQPNRTKSIVNGSDVDGRRSTRSSRRSTEDSQRSIRSKSARAAGRSKSRSSSRTKTLSRNGSAPNLNSLNSADAGFYSWQTHLQRVNSAPLLSIITDHQEASSRALPAESKTTKLKRRRSRRRLDLKRNDSEPLLTDHTPRRRNKSKDRRKSLKRNASVPALCATD